VKCRQGRRCEGKTVIAESKKKDLAVRQQNEKIEDQQNCHQFQNRKDSNEGAEGKRCLSLTGCLGYQHKIKRRGRVDAQTEDLVTRSHTAPRRKLSAYARRTVEADRTRHRHRGGMKLITAVERRNR